MSDLVPDKAALVRPLLQWVGDNIVTLRDRNLLDNLEKPALILLGELRSVLVLLVPSLSKTLVLKALWDFVRFPVVL